MAWQVRLPTTVWKAAKCPSRLAPVVWAAMEEEMSVADALDKVSSFDILI
jgi:hypothetical protein